MHVPTHLMSGWCIGNLLPIDSRQRTFCMIAATAADIDGLGMLVSQRAYFRYHHIVGHNLLMAVVMPSLDRQLVRLPPSDAGKSVASRPP